MHPNSSKKLLRKLRAYRLRRSFALVIGQRLIEAKARLPHGKFLPWIESEFRMSDWTAQNMMRVAKSFAGKSEMITDLAPSALYALAAPSTKVSDTADTFGDKCATVAHLSVRALYALAAS